jgi:hypothetical protein
MSPPAIRKPPTRATAVTGDVATTAPPPEHNKIARLAYAYWQGRGCPDGSPEEDWFRAEEELRRKQAAFEVAKERRRHGPRARTTARTRKSAK